MMKITIRSLVMALAVLVLPACSTTRGVKTAAYLGSALALEQHPEWRAAFELAYTDLGILETAQTIGLPEVLAILHRLPVKELKSPKAVIIITGTMLLIEEIGAPEINAVTADKLRPVVKELRAGIKLALDTAFADYRADGTLLQHASRDALQWPRGWGN